MAWTAPMTAAERAVWTSAQWNAHVRDNLLETMPAKATTEGSYFVSTAANAIAERVLGGNVVTTSETCTDTDYGDLATVGPAVTSTTGSEALVWISCELQSDTGPGAPDVSAVGTYSATGSASYEADGTNRSGFDGGHMFQGFFDSTNGNQFSMAIFNTSSMVADLAGATISKTELFLGNLHFFSYSGGTVYIGTHTNTSLSGNKLYSSVTPGISNTHFDTGQAKWVTVNNSIGNAFRDGVAKGIALGKGPTSSTSYYGYFAGNGQDNEPQLRITYSKPGSSGGYSKASFDVSGATTIAPDDSWAIYSSGMTAANANRWSVCRRVTGLTPGSNVFTMKYAAGVSGATGTFARREIIVMPL